MRSTDLDGNLPDHASIVAIKTAGPWSRFFGGRGENQDAVAAEGLGCGKWCTPHF